MRIAIDIQALQTGSRDRGVGRYVSGFCQELLDLDSENEYVLVANANLEPPRLDGLPSHYRFVSLPYPDGHNSVSHLVQKSALLAGDFDIFHFTGNVFEAFDIVFPDLDGTFAVKVAWTLYDIIPILYPEDYLLDPRFKAKYHSLLDTLSRADRVLTISEHTRQDALKHIGVPPEIVTNISTGINPIFRPLPVNRHQQWRDRLRRKFGVDGQFMFYLGGEHMRKNVAGLIKAYSRLPASATTAHQLVIAGKLEPEEIRTYLEVGRRHRVDERLVFTNFVSDEELVALYSLCTLFVLPSDYEGFGLPLAEAMACGAPVIAYNASSLPEVAGDAGILVEPGSVEQLNDAMGRVILDGELQSEMSRRSLEQARKFTWNLVAGKVLDVYRQLGPRDTSTFNFKRIPRSPGGKPRIALFSPVNPVKSGISDYTEDLLPYLVDHFEIDLYLDSGYSPIGEFVLEHCRWYDHRAFEQQMERESYLAVWYQLGNSPYHAYMIGYIRKYGGIITMHDYGLGGLAHWLSCELTHESPNRLDLYEELVYGYGTAAANAIIQRMQQGRLSPHELAEEKVFLNRRFFDRSIGMIVHSHWAYDMARRDYPDYPDECLRRIPQGIPIMPKLNVEETRVVREQLGIPGDALVVAAFGIVDFPKLPASSIKAFAELAKEDERALLLFVGECPPGYTEPVKLIRKSGLSDRVRVTGYVDFESFYDYMKACDIVLNLRYPTHGETSASLLRALSLAKPVIASNAGAFTDFPDAVVMKVRYAPDCSDQVAEKLMLLARDAELRHRMGENAHTYVSDHHSMTAVSREYAEFILRCSQDRSAQIKLIADFAGKMLARSGISSSDDHTLDMVSRAITRVL